MSQNDPVRVLVTGAAGQIAYSLLFRIANGDMLGKDQKVILHMLDIEKMEEKLAGVVMELDDMASSVLQGVIATSNVQEAFTDIDYAILVGAFPRLQGMERKDLLERNTNIFREQGKALNDFAKKSVKVLVVGNPANTNCAVAVKYAPDLDPKNFSALTRLDHNRAKSQIAKKAGVSVDDVHNVFIWGNHSSTQYPDVTNATINVNGESMPLNAVIEDSEWVQGEFITTVQKRGAAVIAARGFSSAGSAANAIIDHMSDWIHGVQGKCDLVSMAVVSDGSYGIPEGLIFSFPVSIGKDGVYHIVQDLTITEFSQSALDATQAELESERDLAFQLAESSE